MWLLIILLLAIAAVFCLSCIDVNPSRHCTIGCTLPWEGVRYAMHVTRIRMQL